MIPHTNYDGRRPRKWRGAIGKFTYPSRILAVLSVQAAGDIGLHLNADKAEYICFK